MNKNLIIGVLAVAAIYYFTKDQNRNDSQLLPGKDDPIIKPDYETRGNQVAGINLRKVHSVV